MSRCILAAMADSHGGNQLGLLNPETTLLREVAIGQFEAWRPAPTPTQQYLWPLYQSHIAAVMELAAGDDVILLHNGDLTQGNKYPTLLVSDRMADQIIIGEENLIPWLAYANLKAIRLAFGTGAHTFGEGSSEVLIARALAQRAPEVDVRPLYHGLANVRGVLVDYAHHGPGPGIRDWTSANQLRYYLKSLVASDWKALREPPRLVLRAHYHTRRRATIYEELGGEDRQFDIVLLPSYCGMGDHGQQATRSAYVQHHGLVAFEIVDGELHEIHWLVRTLDLRTEETL